MRKKSSFAAATFIASVLVVASATGQDVDVVRAKAMYERGMDALDKNLFDIACPSFAESQRLYAQAGTMFQWAECEDKAGKISSASTRYQLYLNDVKLLPAAKQRAHADRAKQAEARIAALRDEVPTLTVTLVGGSSQGIVVKQDGVELTAVSQGVAIPVDPGEHLVAVQRGTGPVKELRITLEKGEQKTLDLQVPEPEVKVVEPPPPPPPPSPPPPAAIIPAVPKVVHEKLVSRGSKLSAQDIGAVALGGTGLVVLAVGSAFGWTAMSKQTESNNGHCNGKNLCDSTGFGLRTEGVAAGEMSTNLFMAGGVAVGGAIALIATRSRKSDASAHVLVGPTGIWLNGHF